MSGRTGRRTAEGAPALRLSSIRMSFPEGLPGRLSLKRPAREVVLDGIDLELGRGCRASLTGPNGSGKTTVLRLAAGLLLPDSGTVKVFDLDPCRRHSAAARMLGLSLSGERSFYWRLSAKENLEYFGALQGMPRSRLRTRISEALAALGLAEDSSRPVEALSTGYRQRLALARAVLHSPGLLLLDEPFRSLDEESVRSFTGLLDELSRTGTSILVATPSSEEAGSFSDSVFRLGDARPGEGRGI